MYVFAQNKTTWLILILIGITIIINIINTVSYFCYINNQNHTNDTLLNYINSINQINKIIELIINNPIVRSKSIIINQLSNKTQYENINN